VFPRETTVTTTVECEHLTLHSTHTQKKWERLRLRVSEGWFCEVKKTETVILAYPYMGIVQINSVAELKRFYVRTWRPVACVWMQLIVKLRMRLLSKFVNETNFLWTGKEEKNV